MKRRWILIGVLTISLAASILLLQPRKDDGLDFIRKYRPSQEFLGYLGDFKHVTLGIVTTVPEWDRVFVFDKVPEQLLKDIKSKGQLVISTSKISDLKDVYIFPVSKDRTGLYYSSRSMIVVSGEPAPNWLVRQWRNLRRQMGADFTTPRSTK